MAGTRTKKATTTQAKPRAATARRRATRRAPDRRAVAERAYAHFLAEGGGDSIEHWLRAERELTAA